MLIWGVLRLLGLIIIVNGQIKSNIKCACQQIISEVECNNYNCNWIQTSDVGDIYQTGYCDQQFCSQFNEQQCMQESERCYYQASKQQVCYDFSQCKDIVLSSDQTCQQANSRCVQSQQQQFNCQASGNECRLLTQNQCSDKQSTLTDEGWCYWNGSTCQVISECLEIQNESQCSRQILYNVCQWMNQKCIQRTCTSFSTSNTCTFIYNSPLLNAIIQPCFWNGQICINGNSDQLVQYNCAANTNNYYRWIPINSISGICAQCSIYQYPAINQCECQSLFQQIECNNSQKCNWVQTTSTCIPKSCSDFTIQQSCALNKGCYWKITAVPAFCESYTKCQQILGKNSSTCIQSSIYCPGSDGTSCQSQSEMKSCSQLFQTMMQPNICYNSIGNDGYCTYNTQYNQCINITNCLQLNQLQLCKQFNTSCIWKSGQCQQKLCSDFNTQNSCTYIQNTINQNIINICIWNPNTSICTNLVNSINLNINTCYTQSGKTHHWSESQNSQKGLCLPCNYKNFLNLKSLCKCTQLINYQDCISSYPKCYWNFTNSTCNDQICSHLSIQAQCVVTENCYWNSNITQCIALSSSSCSTLQGNTQQECLSQSILCPGVSDKGTCLSQLYPCNSFTQFYQCFGSLGSDGICQWNQTNSLCTGISDCSMIQTQTQCQILLNTCYWINSSNQCMSYNCSTLYNSTQTCNYYLSTTNQQYQVKMCSFEGLNCIQQSNLANLTSSNCYLSSAGTAYWSSQNSENGTCLQCYSQLLSFLLIYYVYNF